MSRLININCNISEMYSRLKIDENKRQTYYYVKIKNYIKKIEQILYKGNFYGNVDDLNKLLSSPNNNIEKELSIHV